MSKLKARWRRFVSAVKPWIKARLREPSTYVGLVIKVAALVGLSVTHMLALQIAEVIAVLVGAALVAWNKPAEPDETDEAGA